MRLVIAVCAASFACAAALPVRTQTPTQPQTPIETETPATLDDAVKMSAFGAVALSPDSRWLVYERLGPWSSAPRFDRGWRSDWAASTLMIAEVGKDGGGEPVIVTEEGESLLFGSWSPTGTRMLVYRLVGERLEAGVVSIAERSVRWTGLTPDLPITGAGAAWLDENRLVLTVRPDGSLPWPLRFAGSGRHIMDRRWADTEGGVRPSRSVFTTRNAAAAPDVAASPLRLVTLNTESGAVQTLAEGAFRDFSPSPDGRQVAVLDQAEATPQPVSERAVQLPVLRRGRLRLVSVEGGAQISVGGIEAAPHLLRWSPDSARLLVWSRSDGEAWSEGVVTLVGRDGRIDRIQAPSLTPLAPGETLDEIRPVRADWLGRSILLWARSSEGGRFDWWRLGEDAPLNLTEILAAPSLRLAASAADYALVFGDGRLWRMAATGLEAVVTDDGAPLSQGEADDQRTPMRQRANAAPHRDWAVARIDRGAAVLGANGRRHLITDSDCDGWAAPRASSLDALAMVCLDQGVETLSVTTRSGTKRVDRLNKGMELRVLPQPRPIRHEDWRGEGTVSYLYLPVGKTSDQVRGLIVHAYPGRAEDGTIIYGSFLRGAANPLLLATGDYAVLSIALADESLSRRESLLSDLEVGVDRAVDAALEAYPGLPADRLALVGHSFGGYTALAVAARSSRFGSVVAWAAPTDMFGFWGEILVHSLVWPEDQFTLAQSIGAAETGQLGRGAPPWEAVDAYAQASPFLQADRIEAPVLLITADRDYVSQTQSELMFTALHRQGKTARLVVYWGEGHGVVSPANLKDSYDQIFGWLDETIGGGTIRPAASDGPPTP